MYWHIGKIIVYLSTKQTESWKTQGSLKTFGPGHNLCKLQNFEFLVILRTYKPVLRIRSNFFRIRIRRFGFQNPDPDPGDPKKTGSWSFLDMFLMFSIIKKLYGIFLLNLSIIWHLNQNKKLFWRNCILDNFKKRKMKGLYVDNRSGSEWLS